MNVGFGWGKKTQKTKPKTLQQSARLHPSFVCGRQPVKIILFSTHVLIDRVPKTASEQNGAYRSVVQRSSAVQ